VRAIQSVIPSPVSAGLFHGSVSDLPNRVEEVIDSSGMGSVPHTVPTIISHTITDAGSISEIRPRGKCTLSVVGCSAAMMRSSHIFRVQIEWLVSEIGHEMLSISEDEMLRTTRRLSYVQIRKDDAAEYGLDLPSSPLRLPTSACAAGSGSLNPACVSRLAILKSATGVVAQISDHSAGLNDQWRSPLILPLAKKSVLARYLRASPKRIRIVTRSLCMDHLFSISALRAEKLGR
jgi:hypothetical protein